MPPTDGVERLDRHALVTAIWLPAGLVAAALLHYGLGIGGPVWVLAGFAALLTAFGAHVIVNVVLGSEFTAREVALGLVLYGCAVLAVGLAVLTVDGFVTRYFLAVSGGLALLAAAVVLYMVTRFGAHRAFESFDVIREFRSRRTTRFARYGGRR